MHKMTLKQLLRYSTLKKSSSILLNTYPNQFFRCIPQQFAHTDIKVPDFSEYRHDSAKDPTKKTSDSEDERRLMPALMASLLSVGLLYATKAELIRYVMFMAASADVLALASIEINLAEIPEGTGVTFKWRGKPLFIRHRTEDEIKIAEAVPMSILRDPQPDSDRVQDRNFLVVLGICTHLGCVPIHNAGDFGPGGYYCPCHGSHFDASGRARKGPAPTNLEVPPYRFLNETTIIVG